MKNIFGTLRAAGAKFIFVTLRAKGVKKVFDILRGAGAIFFFCYSARQQAVAARVSPAFTVTRVLASRRY